ncbi:hypothetical protein TELCIR_25990 [Teladorsagia circumcincta]|uniref:DUF883 domain-containing protein n=1 Tax=Teladorsagia circumcincta TaxID=45464 RepID=A0A2G9T579_TELCI|nr:hypothetical protein TELCIR_25990 [Teladorsagia circumcincta]
MNADNAHNKAQELGHTAKEKMNDAGRAVKNAAEKAGDKAEELKDQAGQKMHDAKEAMKRH